MLQFSLYLRNAAVLTSELSNFRSPLYFCSLKTYKKISFLTCRLLKFLAKIMEEFVFHVIRNGNRTKWSPIRSVIMRLTTSDDRATGVRFI